MRSACLDEYQHAPARSSTLLFGTTICSCLVGRGGFLYWRRAFWICCLTSSRAASSEAAWVVIFGKSGTWAVQPSGDTNSSYLRFPTFFTGIFITLPHSSHFLPIYEKKATFR